MLAAGRRRFVGPGGIGKTWLLDVFAELATGAEARVVRLDGRELSPSPRAVADALADVPDLPDGEGDLARAAVAVLVDSYERLAGLDDWFRGGCGSPVSCFAALDADLIVQISPRAA